MSFLSSILCQHHLWSDHLIRQLYASMSIIPLGMNWTRELVDSLMNARSIKLLFASCQFSIALDVIGQYSLVSIQSQIRTKIQAQARSLFIYMYYKINVRIIKCFLCLNWWLTWCNGETTPCESRGKHNTKETTTPNATILLKGHKNRQDQHTFSFSQ